MKTVWKYPLSAVETMIDMPAGAQPLSVGIQPGVDGRPVVVLWALVDPDATKTARWFQVVGTGNVELADDQPHRFVGTTSAAALTATGPEFVVFHVFETTPEDDQ